MRPTFPAVVIGISASVSMLMLSTYTASSDNQPKGHMTEKQKPTVEFSDEMIIGSGNDDNATASCTVSIKLEGIKQETKIKFDCEGRSAGGVAMVFTLKAQLDGPNPTTSQWKFQTDCSKKPKLIIEGWTDPKTQKFHPVTGIKFESDGIRKEDWPTIKMPPNL